MNVDDLRHLLDGIPGHLHVGAAVLDPIGPDIEPVAGLGAGLTYDLDDDGTVTTVWILAAPTDQMPPPADYRCPCGQLLRYERGVFRDRRHDQCQDDRVTPPGTGDDM